MSDAALPPNGEADKEASGVLAVARKELGQNWPAEHQPPVTGS